MENPFTLVGKEKAPPHKLIELTKEEELEKLQNYLEINPRHWNLLKSGTHIRYYLKDGGYRTGGFTMSGAYQDESKGKICIKLQSSFNVHDKSHIVWSVAHDTIRSIHAKLDATHATLIDMLSKSTDDFNKNIELLVRCIKELEARMKK